MASGTSQPHTPRWMRVLYIAALVCGLVEVSDARDPKDRVAPIRRAPTSLRVDTTEAHEAVDPFPPPDRPPPSRSRVVPPRSRADARFTASGVAAVDGVRVSVSLPAGAVHPAALQIRVGDDPAPIHIDAIVTAPRWIGYAEAMVGKRFLSFWIDADPPRRAPAGKDAGPAAFVVEVRRVSGLGSAEAAAMALGQARDAHACVQCEPLLGPIAFKEHEPGFAAMPLKNEGGRAPIVGYGARSGELLYFE